MTERITPRQFHEAGGIEDWRIAQLSVGYERASTGNRTNSGRFAGADG